MPTTLKELAQSCGLSVSTVSKALNGYSDVCPKTRQRVCEMAHAMGYQPNSLARGLKTGHSGNLGVLYSDNLSFGFTHSFFGPILQAFRREAETHGYDLTFITHRREMSYLRHCEYRNVDGVCLITAPASDPEIFELLASSIPAVTIDFVYNNRTCVQSDNRQGMEMLVRYILKMGHSRVGFITGSSEPNAVASLRRSYFLNMMNTAGINIPEKYIVQGEFHDPTASRRATEQLLGLSERPSCILMSDDYAALGGLETIRSMGLRVPEDISVVGFDGVNWIQRMRPRLATVKQDTERIGSEAAKQLINSIENPRTAYPQIVTVPCELIEGETIRNLNP